MNSIKAAPSNEPLQVMEVKSKSDRSWRTMLNSKNLRQITPLYVVSGNWGYTSSTLQGLKHSTQSPPIGM